MKKLDLRQDLKYLYVPSAQKVEAVTVPAFQFAMIDGKINAGESPSTAREFQDAVGALYGVAYTLKFMSKLRARNPIDYPVMALEGLWPTAAGEIDFHARPAMDFTLMILQPAHITPKMFQDAVRQLEKKRASPALARVRLEKFREGLCIQTMHVGPYADEGRTLDKMKTFAQANGYRLRGEHHEIYLGDPRRAKPEKLRTVLRYGVEKI